MYRERVKLFIIILCITLTVTLSSCSENYTIDNNKQNTNNNGQLDNILKTDGTGKDISVFNSPASKKYVEVEGIISPLISKSILLDFTAKVLEVHVLPGQMVKKGDKLITFSLDQYDLELKDIKSQHNLSKSYIDSYNQNRFIQLEELNRLAADINLKRTALENDSDLELLKLKNTLKKTEAEYERQKENLNKMKTLLENGAISKSEFDEFKSVADGILIDLESAKLDIDIYRNNKKIEIKQLEETYQQKKVQFSFQSDEAANRSDQIVLIQNKIDSMINKTKVSWLKENCIISDIETGVVSQIGFMPGEIIGAGQKVISLDSMQGIIVKVDIPEDDIGNVKLGAQVTIHPFASREKTYKGTVKSISNIAVKKDTGSYIRADISIDDADDWIKLGFNVNARIFY